ncbi:MAG: TlpA disulfide reductase family protein [Bryobacteraceae bacterium]
MRLLSLVLLTAAAWAADPLANRRAPGFALPDIDFNYHDLYDYRGKIVLLDIIQTSCPACNSSAKIYETIRQKFPGKVTILTIATVPDTQDTVRQFIGRNGVKTPVLFDCSQVTGSYLKATPKTTEITLPHVFVIDEKGWIQYHHVYAQGQEKYFESLEPVLEEVTGLVAKMGGGAASNKSGAKKK